MKKQRNRQRANQKKQREKSTQRVTSARRDSATRHRSSLPDFASASAYTAAMMGAAMMALSNRRGKSEVAQMVADAQDGKLTREILFAAKERIK